MDGIKIIEIKKSIYEDNDQIAQKIRKELTDKGVFLLNVLSSPGSGKTTTLVQTINKLKDKYKIAVIETDIDSTVDTKTILNTGVDAIQMHSGGMCHIDAYMSERALNEISYSDYDLVIIENIGNLICTAGYDVGAHQNINILSVPEGDDKPLKYPKMFETVDLVLVNKIDVMPYFNFDLNQFKDNLIMRNENAKMIPISALTGEGIDEWIDWLEEEMNKVLKNKTINGR